MGYELPSIAKLAIPGMIMAMLAGPASATIIGGAVTGGTSGGTFVDVSPIAPGYQVGNNNHQSPDLFGFNEDQNILLAAPLLIDVGGTSIAANTVVASHYVFFDPLNLTSVIGYVDFDSAVLGIITSRPKLDASDILANTNAVYNSPSARGLESNDFAGIDGTFDFRINVDFVAGNPGDYIRVLTARSPAADVPEPATLTLFGLGLLGLGVARRRKEKAAA